MRTEFLTIRSLGAPHEETPNVMKIIANLVNPTAAMRIVPFAHTTLAVDKPIFQQCTNMIPDHQAAAAAYPAALSSYSFSKS